MTMVGYIADLQLTCKVEEREDTPCETNTWCLHAKILSCSDSVRTIRLRRKLLVAQICGVDSFCVAGVGTVREAAEVVRSKSLLFSKLVFSDASEQFLRALVCRESVLQ
jgi:hypothetical protein